MSGLFKGLNVERKAKTGKGRRVLKDRESKAVENAKGALILKGTKASQEVQNLLVDLQKLKKPLSVYFSRKHDEHPFESTERIEKLCAQQDNSLFCLGSTSKKRPARLIFGRMFDTQLLDMQEFAVSNFRASTSFKGVEPCQIGSKPLLVFQGAGFDHDPQLKQTKSLLMDFFRGAQPEKVALNGLDHVIVFTVVDQDPAAAAAAGPEAGKNKVLFRHYRVALKKSGTKLPYVELAEMGPSFDMVLDRSKEPDKGMWKFALKVPKAVKPKKVKNISTTALGERVAKIHLGKQDFNQMHTPHFHGAKGKKRAGVQDSAGAEEKKKRRKEEPEVKEEDD